MRYEEMKPGDISRVVRACPVAYLPWGAIEWHGLHAPVGLDALKAHHMALALCEATGGLVLPPVYCGYQTVKPRRGFTHTFEFSKGLVRRHLFEWLENLYEESFRVMVIVMGHYGPKHVEAIRAGVGDFGERHKYPRVLAITDYDPASWVGVKGDDHGGKNETSLMMYYRPELVDLSLLPPGRWDREHEGCDPDAGQATAAHGEMLARTFVEQAAAKVRELLEEVRASWPEGIRRI